MPGSTRCMTVEARPRAEGANRGVLAAPPSRRLPPRILFVRRLHGRTPRDESVAREISFGLCLSMLTSQTDE